ncbi:hypothetical protein MXB_620 [Myxobolus squamalis]|nr:hypothetical protein MXB_620 [Myxobolus squamalis]
MQDDPSWVLDSHEDCDDEEDDLPRAAETSLDRFTCEIGGKTMFPIIMSKLEPLFSSNIWQHRAAALITLACSAEGCSRDMKPFLPSIIKAIPQFMQDSHPRVVYYCINAIGQLTSDFSGYFHKHFHQEIFPLVISAAEKYSECPRVQAHAICCFINLMEECPPDILELYQDQMFERLHSFFILSAKNLNKPCMPLLLENALSAISILAESLEKGFIKYYRTIAPDLISLIKSFVGTPHIRYYISSFQALSAILLAVGQNECIHEMDSILEVLKSFEIRSYKVDDSDENYRLDYLNIMANIAQVFGDKFSPILPILIPILIELASVSVDSEIISSAITSLETDGDEKIFSKVFSAHTDALKDKNDACLIIKKLCESVKSSMGNHVDELCQVMMTNITDCYDEDIQASACIIFPLLLKCAEMKGENYMIEVWGRIFQCLYTCIIQDSEESTLFSDDRAFLSIKACIEVVSTSGMANEVLLKIVEMFNRQIVEILKYSADQNEKLSISDVIEQNEEEDEEEEDEDDYDDTDDDEMEALLSSIQQVQRTLFKMLKSVYFPFFQQTFENIINLLKSDNPPIKSWAILFLLRYFGGICTTPISNIQYFRYHKDCRSNFGSGKSRIEQYLCHG